MAPARLSVTFILILYLQDSFGKQCLCNGLGLNNNNLLGQQGAQKNAGSSNYNNQFVRTGNAGYNLLQQNQITNSQSIPQLNGQSQICQQQFQSQIPQQFVNSNLQQSVNNHNLQQPLNVEQTLQQQCIRQQTSQIPFNMQIGPQTSQQITDVSNNSPPVVNNQYFGLPSQISNGVLLSNLGLTSNLPSFLPNVCNKQLGDQLSVNNPQNNNVCNKQLGDQLSVNNPQNNMPGFSNPQMPYSKGYLGPSTQASSNNIGTAIDSPVNFQYGDRPQQCQQQFDVSQNSVRNLQNYIPRNGATVNSMQQAGLMQSRPLITSNSAIPPDQTPQIKTPIQSPPVVGSIQFQPVTSFQPESVATLGQNQPSAMSPSVISEPSPNTPLYMTSSRAFPISQINKFPALNPSPKSSNIKALLPLLLNLVKEKNCCGCCCNQNCSHNKGACNKANNFQEPVMYSGYANQMTYGSSQKVQDETSINNTDSDEIRKQNNYDFNRRNDESTEIDNDDNDDSTENIEEDDEDEE